MMLLDTRARQASFDRMSYPVGKAGVVTGCLEGNSTRIDKKRYRYEMAHRHLEARPIPEAIAGVKEIWIDCRDYRDFCDLRLRSSPSRTLVVPRMMPFDPALREKADMRPKSEVEARSLD